MAVWPGHERGGKISEKFRENFGSAVIFDGYPPLRIRVEGAFRGSSIGYCLMSRPDLVPLGPPEISRDSADRPPVVPLLIGVAGCKTGEHRQLGAAPPSHRKSPLPPREGRIGGSKGPQQVPISPSWTYPPGYKTP